MKNNRLIAAAIGVLVVVHSMASRKEAPDDIQTQLVKPQKNEHTYGNGKPFAYCTKVAIVAVSFVLIALNDLNTFLRK